MAPPRTKWTPAAFFIAFRGASEGKTRKEIAKDIGIAESTMNEYTTTKPLLALALKEGRKLRKERHTQMVKQAKRKNSPSFQDIIYSRLPSQLQKYWDRLTEYQREKNPTRKIEKMMEEAGDNVRKALFLHAYQYNSFRISPALRFVNMSRALFDKWKETDLDFLNMMNTMEACKGDFFEDQLVNLCIMGNPQAVIFANKTFNKNRGYGEKVDVNVSGTVHHSLTVLDEEDLECIPIEYRKKLLEKLESKGQSRMKEITVEAVAV